MNRKSKDIYEDYNAERYIHYRERIIRYEEQEVKGKQKKRVKPITESLKISFEEIKSLKLDSNGTPAPTLDTEDYTLVSNYLLDFWGAIMGSEPVMLYLHLKRYAYGKKDFCYPDIETICMKMRKSRPTVNDYLDTLEKYGFVYKFLRRDIEDNNRKVSPLFKIRRYVPMITEEMYNSLEPKLQRLHDEFMKEYEELGYTVRFEKGQLVINELMMGAEPIYNKDKKEQLMADMEKVQSESKQTEFILSKLTQLQRSLNDTFHEYIQKHISPPSYQQWYKNSIYINNNGDTHILIVPNDFTKKWILQSHNKLIQDFINNKYSDYSDMKIEVANNYIMQNFLSRDK